MFDIFTVTSPAGKHTVAPSLKDAKFAAASVGGGWIWGVGPITSQGFGWIGSVNPPLYALAWFDEPKDVIIPPSVSSHRIVGAYTPHA